MRFGNREVMDLVFKDLVTKKPVFYFETLKMTELGNKSATVYAKGGQGNPKLIGWTGERELTLSCEDALVSPESFGLFVGTDPKKYKKVVHEKEALDVVPIPSGFTGAPTGATYMVELGRGTHGYVVDATHPMFVFKSELDGTTLTTELTMTATTGAVSAGVYDIVNYVPAVSGASPTPSTPARIFLSSTDVTDGDVVVVDYYFGKDITELKITSKDFPKTFLVEGFTLWRSEATGKDHIARVTIPKAKLTADFTLSMKPDSDPSTFKFDLEGLKPLRGKDMLIMEIDDEPIEE